MVSLQVIDKCRLFVEFRGFGARPRVIGITIPSLRVDLLRPIHGVPRLHMIHPVSQAGEVLKGLNAILGNADVRLKVLVNVSTAGMSDASI